MSQQTVFQFRQSLICLLQLYAQAWFIVQTVWVGGHFEPLKQHSEYVGKVRHTLQVIKEHARASTSGLAYHHIPNRMLIEMINYVVLWLNTFPTKNGISTTLLLQ